MTYLKLDRYPRLADAATAALFLLVVSAVGCGPSVDGIHPVEGRFVTAEGGDVSLLAGHIVETRLASDPLVRASGEIGADGSFRLETLHRGEIVEGAFEGVHDVRIVLSDDDRERRAEATKAIRPELLEFDRSGLRIDSPPATDPQLEVRLKRR